MKLSVNIDHVATIRNARGEGYPDIMRAASIVEQSDADSITVHLREDRRHIKDEDVRLLSEKCSLPLNFEMAATDEMIAIAKEIKPKACHIVPESREELTTEGGLLVKDSHKAIIDDLHSHNIKVSLFIEPDIDAVNMAHKVGADIIEIHTGTYANLSNEAELNRIKHAAAHAKSLELEVHAGHALNYDNVGYIAKIPEITYLHIGHFLIAESVFIGLDKAIEKMCGIIKS